MKKIFQTLIWIILITSIALILIRVKNVNKAKATFNFYKSNLLEEVKMENSILHELDFPFRGMTNYQFSSCKLFHENPSCCIKYDLNKIEKSDFFKKVKSFEYDLFELRRDEMKLNSYNYTAKFENIEIKIPFIFNNTIFEQNHTKSVIVKIIETGEVGLNDCTIDYENFNGKYSIGFLESEKSLILWFKSY